MKTKVAPYIYIQTKYCPIVNKKYYSYKIRINTSPYQYFEKTFSTRKYKLEQVIKYRDKVLDELSVNNL